jgi:hypothetical protein
MNIDKMAEQFKEMSELQEYANGQYRMIVSLSSKINELEAKNKQLEELLAGSTPIVKNPEIQLITGSTDEEVICRTQLKMFKDQALAGTEFTLEETKRIEIYAKLLLAIKAGDKKAEEELSKNLDDAQLLEFIKDTK